jgi:hypothetical protein
MLMALSACATLGLGTDVQGRYERGLAALAERHFAAAIEHLDWVSRTRPSESVGRHALLARVAAELDPRNPERDLENGARLAARLRDLDADWTRPVGESLGLISAELAAAEERITTAETVRDAAVTVSSAVQQSIASRLETVAAERDSLRRRASTLEQQLTDREKQLQLKEQELERIRKIIRR